MKSLRILGLMTLAAMALLGQPPTTGAQYWSTTRPFCADLGGPVVVANAAGTTIGYSCYVSGTFPWLAAGGKPNDGGIWTSSIRVSAPASGAIGVDYSFYDTAGNNLSLDTSGSSTASSNDVTFALAANQPSEVRLLGATSDPTHADTSTGSAYAIIYCPNATTCQAVLPQLIYSNSSPQFPWALSVPIAWDDFFSSIQPGGIWTQWSATGNSSGPGQVVSVVIYNQNTVNSIYTVHVYDDTGALVGQGTTDQIPGYSSTTQQGGTRGFALTDVIKTALPTGIFKVTVDGGSNYSSVVILQFSGTSATSLQVAFDTSSSTTSLATPVSSSSVSRSRVTSAPKRVFSTVTQ